MAGQFEIVGMKETEQREPKQRKKWYEGKPVISMAVLVLIVTGCLACDLIMTKDPFYLDLKNCNVPPNLEFRFGTDTMGRDIFSMIWYGGRISLFIGVVSTVISTAAAVIFGTVSASAPAWADHLLMRFAEILISVPGLLMVIFVQAVLGEANVLSLSFVIGITGWMGIAKVIRTEVRRLRSSEYVIASRCMGGSFSYTMASPGAEFYIFYHVHGGHEYPNCHCGRVDAELHGDRAAG